MPTSMRVSPTARKPRHLTSGVLLCLVSTHAHYLQQQTKSRQLQATPCCLLSTLQSRHILEV
ncbi:hypothetical protein C0Q70_09954 [Pomacea canaliculata]|uniref:Uncharacterized protein n=1 Tax=Pomacea canaliculata TaxID=400727 RepID=A0A2T7PB84_POMCA|nr:hypothetical protein C0Q70_09954 [Pomacea canaliculata]